MFVRAKVQRIDMEEKEKNSNDFLKGFISGALLFAAVAVAFVLVKYNKSRMLADKGLITADGIYYESELIDDRTMSKMKMIEYIIDKYYLNEYTIDDMREGIYVGMIDSLGDRYGEYYTAEEVKDVRDKSNGTFGGIGAYISYSEENQCCVIAGVFDDAPAQNAGVRTGDLIYMIDGEDVSNLNTDEVVSLVRGPEGTTVHLTLVREGADDLIEVDIVRDQIERDTVYSEMLDDDQGYIQITEFDNVTFDQFVDALAVLKGKGAKGIVLDLRSNPGGNLDTACDIARYIIPKGIVCYTIDKYDNKVDYTCNGEHELDLPLVILVNGYSASASEILTGAAKDHGKARVVGTTTFGKGIVQTIVPLSDGSAVKLTTSSYYTPSGVCIHGTGIEPDVVSEFDSEKYYNEGIDVQLDDARKELSSMIGK